MYKAMSKMRWMIALSVCVFTQVLMAQDYGAGNARFSVYGDLLVLKREDIKNQPLVCGKPCELCLATPIPAPFCPPNSCFVQGGDDMNIFATLSPTLNPTTIPTPTPTPPNNNNNIALTTRDLVRGFDYEPGYRIGMVYLKREDQVIEANFYAIDQWDTTQILCSNAGYALPSCVNCFCDYVQADSVKVHFTSKLYNGELNYWGYVTPRRGGYFSFAGLIGGRYMQIDEEFNMRFTRFCCCSDYHIETENRMIGPQLGGVLYWYPTCTLTWGATCKFGYFLNCAKQCTDMRDCNNRILRVSYCTDKHVGTFFSDSTLDLQYAMFDNVYFHIGYQALWLWNLVEAPNQVDENICCRSCSGDGFIRKDGKALIHGFLVGLSVGF